MGNLFSFAHMINVDRELQESKKNTKNNKIKNYKSIDDSDNKKEGFRERRNLTPMTIEMPGE